MATKRTADSFSDFERIRERLDRAWRLFGGSPGSPNFCAPYMEPPVDVYQTDSHIVVLMEIAGVAGEEIELQVEGMTMVVRGERKPLPGRPKRVYSQMEITTGLFQREIALPTSVNPEDAQAVYKDGMLEITMPKTVPMGGTHLRIVVR
jgi:HSP20 family protein